MKTKISYEIQQFIGQENVTFLLNSLLQLWPKINVEKILISLNTVLSRYRLPPFQTIDDMGLFKISDSLVICYVKDKKFVSLSVSENDINYSIRELE